MTIEEAKKIYEDLEKAFTKLNETLVEAAEHTIKVANILKEVFDSYYKNEQSRKIYTGWKHKSIKRVPDYKMSTYNYKPAMRRNLPYQRRNF